MKMKTKMKTKLIYFLILLISVSVGAQNTKIVSLESCISENPNVTCNWPGGAYFNLTEANPILLGNLNPNDYVFESYKLEDDFSPITPVESVNNFYLCDREQGWYVSVWVRNIVDTSKSFAGRIKLIFIKKPKLIVNNNSVYPVYLDGSGNVYTRNTRFQFFLDGATTPVLGYSLSNIPAGIHTITYKALNLTGVVGKCSNTETVNITGNFPTNPIKVGLAQRNCIKNDTSADELSYDLTFYKSLFLGALDPTLYTISYTDRDTQTIITNPTNFSSQPNKFVDVLISNNLTSLSYTGEIKLFKSNLPAVTATVTNNNVFASTSFDGDFLYSIKLQSATSFGTPQFSPTFNNLPVGAYNLAVYNIDGASNCNTTTDFIIENSTLGLNKVENISVSSHPNPTSGLLKVSLKNNVDIIDSIEVNNILGELILNKTINNYKAEIDLSSEASGIYFVKLKSKGAEKVMKVVKQ
jgi:hypothetical protein